MSEAETVITDTPTERETELATALAAAEAEAREARDAQLRALAELDNQRKRAARDLEQERRYAVERLAADLVAVLDSLELGLAAAGSDAGQLVEGMRMTQRQLLQALERHGVSVLDPAGEAFDADRHEAMIAQPSAEHPAGTVLTVVQKGYLLNGRLLRPARVVVSRAPDPAGG
jgi:molecular chaperone GrpE